MWIWQQPDWPQGRLAITPLLSEMSATQAVMSPLVAQGQQLKARQRLRLEATLLSEEMEACARLSGVVFGRAALRDALYQALGLESGQLEAPRGQVPGIDVFVDVMLEVVRTAFQPLAREQVLEWHRRLGPFLPRSSGQRLGEWRDGPHEAVSGRYGLKRLRYRAPGMTGDELADELERFWQRLEEEEPELLEDELPDAEELPDELPPSSPPRPRPRPRPPSLDEEDEEDEEAPLLLPADDDWLPPSSPPRPRPRPRPLPPSL